MVRLLVSGCTRRANSYTSLEALLLEASPGSHGPRRVVHAASPLTLHPGHASIGTVRTLGCSCLLGRSSRLLGCTGAARSTLGLEPFTWLCDRHRHPPPALSQPPKPKLCPRQTLTPSPSPSPAPCRECDGLGPSGKWDRAALSFGVWLLHGVRCPPGPSGLQQESEPLPSQGWMMLVVRMDLMLSMDAGLAHLSAAVRSAAANTGVQTPLPTLLSVPLTTGPETGCRTPW